MNSVRYCLDRKGYQVWTIQPNAFVFDALRLMSDKEIGALVVMEKEQVTGIFSERDYARKIILQGKSSRETRVGEIMTDRVVFVGPDQGIEECMVLMTEYRVRHLPVLDNGTLVGIISIGDIVKEIIEEQKFVIEQLENYITGKR